MYLTELEHEAFLRGRAAGLIPADVPLPTCDKEIDELILHVGFLFSREIAYRNRQKKLRLMTLTAFTEEHLNDLTVRLPELRPEEVFAVTKLQREVYLNPLEGLYHYFAFGRKIVSADDPRRTACGRYYTDSIFSNPARIRDGICSGHADRTRHVPAESDAG